MCHCSSLGLGLLAVAWVRAGSSETLVLVFLSSHPLSSQWEHGVILDVRDLGRMLVFPLTTGKEKQTQLIRLSLCVNETKSASYNFSSIHGLSI